MKQPKAFISKNKFVLNNLQSMIDADEDLYSKLISTPGIAFDFGQIVNKAIHYDYIVNTILKDYELNLKEYKNENR